MKIRYKKIFFQYICLCFLSLLRMTFTNDVFALPIKTTIINDKKQDVGKAHIYIDYIELMDLDGNQKGKLGFVNIKGGYKIFVVAEDGKKNLLGTAKNRLLFDNEGKLIAHYDWTTFWSYVYSPNGKKLGKAKCIAFRGICAAGIASFLTGILY